jgi:photosystem II stability/assembly factor-like uncharacterized protein
MKKLIILIFIISSQIALCQWESINNGLKSTYVFDLLKYNGKILAGTGKGMFLSSDNGNSWIEINNGIASPLKTHVTNLEIIDTVIFAIAESYSRGIIYYSSDLGLNWSKTNYWIEESILSSTTHNNTLFVSTYTAKGVFYATYPKLIWEKFDFSFTTEPVEWFQIIGPYQLAMTDVEKYLSIDNGDNWSIISIINNNTLLNSFAIIDNNLFIGSNDTSGIYISHDNGLNWSQKKILDYSKPDYGFKLLAYDNYLFAGAYSGVYLSLDFGENWTKVSKNYLLYFVGCLLVSDGYLIVGTYDGGAFRAKVSDLVNMVGVNKEENPNLNYKLSVFPNPATKSLIIRLLCDNSNNNVQINITNNLGEILQNINSNDNLNNQGLNLDVSTYPSGLYFCTVRTGSYVETQPFLVIH